MYQIERSFKLERKIPTRYSRSHMSGQTVVTRGLQIANAPCPCWAGLDPGQLEKGQDWSLCPGSCNGNPDTTFIPLAPTGACFQPWVPTSLSRPYSHGPHLSSFTHPRSAAANPFRNHYKSGMQTVHVCVHACV